MSSTQSTRDVSRQRMWPLFAVALSLLGVGLYVVFFTGSAVDEPEGDTAEPVAVDTSVPEGVERMGEDVRLAYVDEPGAFRLRLERETTRSAGGSSSSLQSRLELTVHDAVVSEVEGIVFDRTYSDVAITLVDDGKKVGTEITHEVERLLETASHRVTFAPNGELESFELTSSQAAQLRQTLALLEDAFSLLTPHVPGEPVNVAETWVYEAPMELSSEESRVELAGNRRFETTFEGIGSVSGKRAPVVSQALTGEASGTFRREDETQRVSFEAHGDGRGLFYFDGAGRIARAELEYRQEMSFPDADESTTSVVKMRLRQVE